jgi:hypothetical protein
MNGWILHPHPDSHVEVFSPNVTVFGVRAFKELVKVNVVIRVGPHVHRVSALYDET